jgi:hypothetical protein
MEPDSQLSPALLKKVVHAAACSTSFRQAAEDLCVLAEVKVSAQRVRRAAERVGEERVAQSRARVKAYQRLPLPAQQQSSGERVPQVACIQTDGGRIQIRPRAVEITKPTDQEHWWRETKVGCLLSMTSETHGQDPTPTIPVVFVDPARMAKITREIKGFSGEAAREESAPQASEAVVHKAPQVVSQTVVATRENVDRFGERLVAAAHSQGFAAAGRKAFVADGSETNWGLWRRHFSRYTPILDWVHAVCYVYAAAMAGVAAREGWAAYRDWAQWLWSGRIDRILEQLEQRQAILGLPTEVDAETSPRHRVADALRYLSNQRARMNYPDYRRQGLPITSSHVESTIKRINRRMKGSEKFWDQGAEPLLHLVADHLGPRETTENFWADRPGRLDSQRCYCPAT